MGVCTKSGRVILLTRLARHRWGRLFSSEPEVIRLVATVLPLMAAFQLADGLSGATGGLLRGAGRAVSSVTGCGDEYGADLQYPLGSLSVHSST